MKTTLLLFTLFYFSFFQSNGQFKTLAEGPVFDNPEDGWANVTQLKNGNTLFLFLQTKRHFKITFDFYDKEHKKINEGNFTPDDPDLALSVENIFEINGDVIIFLSTNIKHKPVLQRLIIDGRKGIVKNFSNVANITPPAANPYNQRYSIEKNATAYIVKAPGNDKYAIISLERDSLDKRQKPFISIFDNNHKVIKSFFVWDSLKSRIYNFYGKMTYIDADRIAVICSASMMTPGNSGKDLVIINPEKNETNIIALPPMSGLPTVEENIQVNSITKQILMFASVGNLKKDTILDTYLTCIDIPTQKTLYSKKLSQPAAIKKNIELFGEAKAEATSIAAQNFFINNDGGISVVYEGISIRVWHSVKYSDIIKTYLGSLLVAQYDKNGNETGSILIPKRQEGISEPYSIFHDGGSSNPTTRLVKGNEYKSFLYFTGPKKSYVLFNDDPNNGDKSAKGKLDLTASAKDGDAYYIDLSQNELLAIRNNFFSKSNDKDGITPGLFPISDYDKQNNIFVTIKFDPKGRDKGLRLVWLQPQ